ncbi:MAG: N-acetylmuramoyl-L-alanine amidase [Muribaculaceae bacterium]|nr:N-acetylmuramoyl-L-alanine amidase [Muribaculaceae bacterium]
MKLHNLKHIIKSLSLKHIPLCLSAVLLSAVSVQASSAAAAAKGTKQFTVVIDPGHGGHDYGAVDNNANEKDINLGVAKKLNSLLEKKMKGVKAVLTRSDDTFISLQERANIANRSKGDLFISIHTNSVDKNNPNRKTVAGANVYALGPQKDSNNLRVAQRENSVIELESDYKQKYSGFDPNKDESYIIFEMAQKKNLGKSLRFADFAQKELVKTAGRKDRGVKQAGFWVLWATSMPAVLVELDFICNPESAAYLTSDRGQQEMAQSIFNAIEHYLDISKPVASAGSKNTAQTVADISPAIADADSEIASTGTYNTTQASRGQRVVSKAPARATSAANAPRRRRSQSAKKTSDERALESAEILVLSEEVPGVKESVPEEKVIAKAEPETKTKGKSNQDKKNKNKKDSKNNSKAAKSNHTKRTNQKTYVVKNNTAKQSAEVISATGNSVPKPKLEADSKPAVMYYQIQLLASATEVSADHASFCGLVPTGSFLENGLYKYTYGRSESRREMENKLLEVKQLIPDAFIIVRAE